MTHSPRFNDYREIVARFDSIGACGHPVKKGDYAGAERGLLVTHNLGNPRPYRAVCRELYRHEERIRQERPIAWEPTLRPWVRRVGRLAWVLMLALLALATFCTFGGW